MAEFSLPETRYALNGDVDVAYQVMGEGPIDIVMVPGAVAHLESNWTIPHRIRNSVARPSVAPGVL